jgi:hypothetical protein
VRKAQLLLWASSPAPAPKQLEKEVAKLRKSLKQEPSPLRVRVPVPLNAKSELPLRNQLMKSMQDLARMISALEESVEALKELTESRDSEPLRVQAQLDFMLASTYTRLAYLEEHATALGQMRKEFPPRSDKDRNWVLVTKSTVRDSASKKYVKAAKVLFHRVMLEHPVTVWETLAQQALDVDVGVSWRSVP